MKLDDIKARLWPEKEEATPSDVARIVGEKAREFAQKKILEAEQRADIAYKHAKIAEETAKAQVESLQRMYIEMLTLCHQEIADLNRKLTMKTANA